MYGRNPVPENTQGQRRTFARNKPAGRVQPAELLQAALQLRIDGAQTLHGEVAGAVLVRRLSWSGSGRVFFWLGPREGLLRTIG